MTPIVEGFPAAAMCPSSAWPERGIEAIGNETNRLRAGDPLIRLFPILRSAVGHGRKIDSLNYDFFHT